MTVADDLAAGHVVDEPSLIVPAYFHPAVSDGWAGLPALAPRLRAVVLNVDSGPGRRVDPAFVDPVRALLDGGVVVLGYVNTDYGVRNPIEVAEETRRYHQLYGVADVFLDRVSAGWDGIEYYQGVTRAARDLGARTVAFNHGVSPVSGYADHADLLGTFEGDRGAYQDVTVPQWVRRSPPERFFHIVYGVPPDRVDETVALAAHRNAGTVLVTERDGANPFDRLPARWDRREETS